MFFSFSSAVREMQRNNKAGINTTIKKMWYGWIVVDGHCTHRVIDRKTPVTDKELIEHIHFTLHGMHNVSLDLKVQMIIDEVRDFDKQSLHT